MHLLKFKYNTLKYFSKLVLYLIFILFHIYYSIYRIVGKMGIMIPESQQLKELHLQDIGTIIGAVI